MSLIGSDTDNSSKATRLDDGLVKFPPNIHSIRIRRRQDGYTDIVVMRNELTLTFVADNEDCEHLASLLKAKPPPSL